MGDNHTVAIDSRESDVREEEVQLLREKSEGDSNQRCLSVSVSVAYGLASIVTTLANKALLSTWDFGYVFTLLFLQNVLTVLVVGAVKLLVPRPSPGSDFPLWDGATAVAMMPVMVFFCANLFCGMSALQLSSVPVYQTLKRMTPLPAMALDRCLRGKRFSLPVCLSVLVVCVGALLTGMGDLQINSKGYAFALASCVLQALYLVLASRASDARPLSSLAAAHYNALLSLPLLTFGVWHERDALAAFGSWGDARFVGMLVLDLVLGASLALLLFMCTLVNSALTTTIVGNAKAVATTALGALLFGSVGLQPLGWAGVGINTAGGVLYTVAKSRERHQAPRVA